MIDFSLKLVLKAADTGMIPAGMVVASLNMLICHLHPFSCKASVKIFGTF